MRERGLDNLTHSLIGIAFARSVRRGASEAEESLAVAASVWASNLADLDSLVSLHGGKLEYLLQHRGYTHTVACAPVIAAAGTGLAYLGSRHRSAGVTLRKVLLVALGAALLHVVFDGLNDYGVHPFWPLWNHWIYGDSIFIVEPLLIAILLPYAVVTARSRLARWFLAGLGVAMLIGLWAEPFTLLGSALVVTLLGVGLVVWHRRGLRRPCFEALVVVLLVFAWGHRSAARAMSEQRAAGDSILSLSTTPAPANPFCWRTALATISADRTYRVRVASLTLWPALVSAEACDAVHRTHGMPPRLRDGSDSPRLVWSRGYSAPLEELARTRHEKCRFDELLHFAKLPFLTGESAGDLRYDRGDGESFATIDLAGECLPIPPWVAPFDEAPSP